MSDGLIVDACCGPCAMAALRILAAELGRSLFLFSNSNVHPYSEYARRLEVFRKVMDWRGMAFEVLPYRPEEWMRAVSFREESRCAICYRLRLEKVADEAKARDVETFTTTLLASPYQDRDLIIHLGESLAKERGLSFLAWDGREIYRDVLREAQEKGIYTQPYCGCLLSERERYDPSFRRRVSR